jgi:2-polyprenyl-3-methyl-5-hydroxy-6-metoxy-1,4-benzoquinol methylase
MEKHKDWQVFFDHHAPEYMDNVFTKNTKAEIEFLLNELNLLEGSSILDVGCGTGRHSVELAKCGYKVTGIDLSPGMLAEAQKAADEHQVGIEFIQADATEYRSDKLFDAVICLCEGAFTLLCMDEDPVEHDLAILKNIHWALKDGGIFLLTALNAMEKIRRYTKKDIEKGVFDPKSIVEVYDMEYKTKDGESKSVKVREKGYVASELTLLMQMAGFRVENIYGGTAGNWGHRQIDPDEIEIMVIAKKVTK